MASNRKKKARIIEKLRKLYPGLWRYEGMGRWVGPDFEVQAYSVLNNNYDGDESYSGVYERTDTHERIPQLSR